MPIDASSDPYATGAPHHGAAAEHESLDDATKSSTSTTATAHAAAAHTAAGTTPNVDLDRAGTGASAGADDKAIHTDGHGGPAGGSGLDVSGVHKGDDLANAGSGSVKSATAAGAVGHDSHDGGTVKAATTSVLHGLHGTESTLHQGVHDSTLKVDLVHDALHGGPGADALHGSSLHADPLHGDDLKHDVLKGGDDLHHDTHHTDDGSHLKGAIVHDIDHHLH